MLALGSELWCYFSGNFSSGVLEPGPTAASLGGLCCRRKQGGSGSVETSRSIVSLLELLYKGVNWISLSKINVCYQTLDYIPYLLLLRELVQAHKKGSIMVFIWSHVIFCISNQPTDGLFGFSSQILKRYHVVINV